MNIHTAARMALDALETGYHQGTQDAIVALREALAQPTPGPVASTYWGDDGYEHKERRSRHRDNDDPRIDHLFNGFDNMIRNADDYSGGYLRAMRREFGELVRDAAPPAAPAPADLIPPDALFVCGQMGANITRVRAESAAPVVREPLTEPHPVGNLLLGDDWEDVVTVTQMHNYCAAKTAELRDALETARNGLQWYRDTYPEAASGCDDEAMQQIDVALGIGGGGK